jgi:2-keto-4-pentenoate hydratase
MDQSAVDEVAKMFVRARQTGERLDALPARLKPRDNAEARQVMAAVDKLIGEPIVGWKIAGKPGTEPAWAPLHKSRVFTSPARIPRAVSPSLYMEGEIMFRLTRDLPARAADYSEQEVFDALEGCAAIEAVDSRFKDLAAVMKASLMDMHADHISHGAMILGEFQQRWRDVDFGKTRVTLRQGSRTIVDRIGGHPTVNPSKPVVVLANIMRKEKGLAAGTIVATGSFTAFHPIAPDQAVTGEFDGFGTVEATIES